MSSKQEITKKKQERASHLKVPAIVKTSDSSKGLQSQQKSFLKKENWAKVFAMTGESRKEFLTSLFDSGQYSDKQLAEMMASHYHLQKIDFSDFELNKKTVQKISRKICEKYNLIPVMEVEGTLVVAFSDPGDIQARDNISLLVNSKVEMVVAERGDIKKMINYYHTGEDTSKMNSLFSIVESSTDNVQKDVGDVVNKKIKYDPTVQTVDYLIQEGVRLNCSDIHIEVYEKNCRVRYRVDGHLKEYINPPINLASSISSRIKVLSRLDISERRLPQDGRLKIKIDDQLINFRVSIVPVVSGEKIVLRILDTSALATDISKLGMNKNQEALFQKHLSSGQGLILMTGPTGSGKTTTIYSGLQQLNTPDKNISTAEDPVEYKLHGINQVQVNEKIGLSFASVLRSFLRQDPDVILVGEIRDQETANIAYRAAATGHLVLSTLHTNDAPSTITRLMDIGMPAYSVAENTSVVVAQRLLRVLCSRCKVNHNVDLSVLQTLGFSEPEAKEAQPRIMKGEGCQYCNYTGYKGRMAVFEVLNMFPDLKIGVFKGLSPRELKMLAIEKNNLQTLRKSALEKLLDGLTSVDEVMYGTIGDD
ncbi:MAG: ATPase, T2SS/T4P/T4SS family [Bdellovibrionales bacterium]|nr:ATPase, T2SS/T4P/T4SS family [Bdellovibrionales bacterium]